jgi:hypothetical protein
MWQPAATTSKGAAQASSWSGLVGVICNCLVGNSTLLRRPAKLLVGRRLLK